MTDTLEIHPCESRHGQPYRKIDFDFEEPHALYHLNPLFASGTLFNANDEVVDWADLRGLSVALYFGAGNVRACRNFLPFLTQFYRTINESSLHQKVEVIYIPLDETAEECASHANRMPWLRLKFDDPVLADFQQHFQVFCAPERPKFGALPTIPPPHLAVVAADGRTLRVLTNEQGTSWHSNWNYAQDFFA